ncbi:hypothetical protein HYDPIDRAFT_109880 [Hydnomerulius pinastri MD-312]|nr:hypothetical protein HYDPIDRAFT_109880 [Hydnomerulius pinastri MD-312]
MYPDPSVFRPERFFKGDGTLNDGTVSYTFSFGRAYALVAVLLMNPYGLRSQS